MALDIHTISSNWAFKERLMTEGQMNRFNLWYRDFEVIKSYNMVIAKRFVLPGCVLCLIAEPKVSNTTNRHISIVHNDLRQAGFDVILEVPQSFSVQGRELLGPYTNIHSIWKAFIECAKHHLFKAKGARSRKSMYINEGLRALAGANLIRRSFTDELPDSIQELRHVATHAELLEELRIMAAMEVLKKA